MNEDADVENGEPDERRRWGVVLSAVAVRLIDAGGRWLRSSRLGITVAALVVGVCAGFGAVGFRWLIYGATWIVTGREQFGQAGRIGSAHLPGLGIWFLLLIPVIGGLVYGPLIQRFARRRVATGCPRS